MGLRDCFRLGDGGKKWRTSCVIRGQSTELVCVPFNGRGHLLYKVQYVLNVQRISNFPCPSSVSRIMDAFREKVQSVGKRVKNNRSQSEACVRRCTVSLRQCRLDFCRQALLASDRARWHRILIFFADFLLPYWPSKNKETEKKKKVAGGRLTLGRRTSGWRRSEKKRNTKKNHHVTLITIITIKKSAGPRTG